MSCLIIHRSVPFIPAGWPVVLGRARSVGFPDHMYGPSVLTHSQTPRQTLLLTNDPSLSSISGFSMIDPTLCYDGLTPPASYTQGDGKYAHDLLSKPGGADITDSQGTTTVVLFSPSSSAGGH